MSPSIYLSLRAGLFSRNEMGSDRSVFIRLRDLNYDRRDIGHGLMFDFQSLMDVRVTRRYWKSVIGDSLRKVLSDKYSRTLPYVKG